MPRVKRRRAKKTQRKKRAASKGSKRGRKPIFTDEQKRVLDRLIKEALRDQLRGLLKGL